MSSVVNRPVIKEVAAKVARLREDVKSLQGSVKKLRKTVEAGIEDIHEAIYDNIEAQAELKLMERLAEVRTIPPQVAAENERIAQEKRELAEELERLTRRYERKHEELDDRAERRVRNVGEHIFEIQEDEFEDGVETLFTDLVTPVWGDLQDEAEATFGNRRERLDGDAATLDATVDDYLRDRQELIDRIERYRLEPEFETPIERPTRVEVPYWVVTVERDGEEERTVVTPGTVHGDGDGWFTARIDRFQGFQRPFEESSRTEAAGYRERSTRAEDLAARVDDYARTRYGLLNYADELAAALPEKTPIRVEERGE